MNPREKRIRQFIAEAQWQYKKEMPESLREGTWLHAFDDIHLDRLDRAMKQILGDSKYFPLPADIKEIAKGLQPNAEEIAEREERTRQNQERLMRGIEAARQKQLEAPIRSILLDPPKAAPKRSPMRLVSGGSMKTFTAADFKERMAELERQKQELLRVDSWGKEVTKHGTPIPREVLGAELDFLLYDPASERRVM